MPNYLGRDVSWRAKSKFVWLLSRCKPSSPSNKTTKLLRLLWCKRFLPIVTQIWFEKVCSLYRRLVKLFGPHSPCLCFEDTHQPNVYLMALCSRRSRSSHSKWNRDETGKWKYQSTWFSQTFTVTLTFNVSLAVTLALTMTVTITVTVTLTVAITHTATLTMKMPVDMVFLNVYCNFAKNFTLTLTATLTLRLTVTITITVTLTETITHTATLTVNFLTGPKLHWIAHFANYILCAFCIVSTFCMVFLWGRNEHQFR